MVLLADSIRRYKLASLYLRAPLRFLLLISVFASTNLWAQPKWAPPPEGVVRDGAAAISIARAIWISLNPGLPKASEEVWQIEMVASLRHGIWHVEQKPLPRGSLGGGLVMEISRADGRVTLIMITQ
jgi:hypothetical protein